MWILAKPLRGAVKRAPGMVAGQTTGVPALRARDHRPSADVSGEHHSRSVSDHPPTSPNTSGRQTQVFGSRTFGSPTGPEEWMMTILSFSIFPFAWGNMFGNGLNSSRTTASATLRTSRGSSSEISRGRMFALETLGTSRVASRSPASPYEITSAGSPIDPTPSLMSSTQTSSAHSSLG